MWVAVAGPSGAGKDTLLDGARAALAEDARFHFAQRVVSRPTEAGGEAHEFLLAEEFGTADLVLRWEAHGLRYGIRRAEVERAPVTVMSLSRQVLREAAALHPLLVVEITAPREVLQARLLARGREAEAQIRERLEREVALPPGLEVRRCDNIGPVEEGVDALVKMLRTCAEGRFPP